ncbi:uncharacterized protein LOC142073222 isoform X2 [Caretta caretta]|uniref:uncharacterized protein LOC142073222 isoform X2 n=1 Tax=Caretta caretta TaxID=8467 RepID=UPI003F4B5DE6
MMFCLYLSGPDPVLFWAGNQCRRDRFSGSTKDLLKWWQSTLRSTLVLQLSKKSKGSRPESISCRHSAVKTPGYHKAREANHHSGAAPKTCQFYKELDAILAGDPSSTAKSPVDTSVGLEAAERGPNLEGEVIDEEVELDDDMELPVEQAARNCSPLWRCLASLGSCSLGNKKQERRCLMWLSGTPHTHQPNVSTR